MRDDDILIYRRPTQGTIAAPRERKLVHRDEDMVFRRRLPRNTPSPYGERGE